jgi:hypothetical protein
MTDDEWWTLTKRWRVALSNLSKALRWAGFGAACEMRGREIGHDEGVVACERDDRARWGLGER